jgi:hypothetical protein
VLIGPGVQCERTVLRRSGRLVGEDDHARTGRPGVSQAESVRRLGVAEETSAGSEDHRIDEQPEHIDEVVCHQGLSQVATPMDLELPPRLRLQFGDFVGDVVAEQPRVAPSQGFEGGGGHVLRAAVEGGGHRVVVGDVRPMAGEDLVGLPAQEKGIGLLEDAVDDLAHVVVGGWDQPAAILEFPAPVLVRPSGRLHDAVQGQKGGERELHPGLLV